MYSDQKPIEINKHANYFGFPGMIDKSSFTIGKRATTKDDKTMLLLIEKILSFYEFTLSELLVPCRKAIKVRAKYMCYYILYAKYGFKQIDIAPKFNVDRTTVTTAIQKLENQLYIKNGLYYNELQSILIRIK